MKTQQQTLSVRVSDAVRRRLEAARLLLSKITGDPVSLSDVAKRLLEGATADASETTQLIEAAEMLSRPTEALVAIRNKMECGQSLSRAEWIVVGYYVQSGCEAPEEGSELTAESFSQLLEAFVAAYEVRADNKASPHDPYYRSNLRLSEATPGDRNAAAPAEPVTRLANSLIRKLRADPTMRCPRFSGRNLHVLFRDERIKGIEILNGALQSHLPALFRIAARGHFLTEGRPVREQDGGISGARPMQPPPLVVGKMRLSTMIDAVGELSMLLSFEPQRVLYPLHSYPVVKEFSAMVHGLAPGGKEWKGRYFFGYAAKGSTSSAVNFHNKGNGVTVGFSAEEWRNLGKLMTEAMALPELQAALEESAMVYGEI